MSRAQRLRSLSAIGNAYGITMRAIEAFDGRSLAMQEDAKAFEGASATRVPSPEEIANGWRSNVEAAQLLAAPRSQRYSVNVYDRAGEFARRPCADFATVLETAKALREKYPGKVVLAFNLDRCDYNTDGLTEDEAEALNDAVSP